MLSGNLYSKIKSSTTAEIDTFSGSLNPCNNWLIFIKKKNYKTKLTLYCITENLEKKDRDSI